MRRRKQMLKKVLCTVLCVGMVAGMTACGGQEVKEESSQAAAAEPAVTEQQEEEEVVELTYFGTDTAVLNGIQDNDVMKYIEEKFHIRLNVVSYSADQWAALMSSGDLPDIFQMSGTLGPTVEDYIEGNLIMELSDLVEERGANIQSNASYALDYMRNYKSNGTGGLYGIPTYITTNNEERVLPQIDFGTGLRVRWDYYKEMGYPEVTSEDELLDMLKQMQEAHSANAEGLPVYAFGGFNDMGLWSYYVPYAFGNGWMNSDGYLTGPNGEVQSMFGEDADVFYRAMKFLNKAYRMGLCDPEMFTMTQADFAAKHASLRYLTVPCNWWDGDAVKSQEEQGITDTGFYQIPGAFPAIYARDYKAFGATDMTTAIAANCEHPEKAMEFLDFIFSYDGARLFYSGFEGENWKEADGEKVLTEDTLARYNEDQNTFKRETGINLYNNMVGLSNLAKDEDGEYINIFAKERVKNVSPGAKLFAEHYGFEYPAQVYRKLEEEGKVDIIYYDLTSQSMMEPLTSDLQMINSQCNNYYLTLAAQLITSDSEEAFEENWKNGCASLADMGYGELYDFIKTSAANAWEEYQTIMGK